jgi:hypothetical protein
MLGGPGNHLQIEGSTDEMQDGSVAGVLTLSHSSDARRVRPLIPPARLDTKRGSGRTVQANGMVRDVFVQVREHQQQVQHALPLFQIGFSHFLFEVFDDGERIRQQPFEIPGRQGAAFAAANERVVCANKRFIKKMVKAKLLVRERSRD